VRNRDVYQVDLSHGTSQLTSPGVHLVSIVRGVDTVCSPLDLDLRVSDGFGFAMPIMAKSITKLSPNRSRRSRRRTGRRGRPRRRSGKLGVDPQVGAAKLAELLPGLDRSAVDLLGGFLRRRLQQRHHHRIDRRGDPVPRAQADDHAVAGVQLHGPAGGAVGVQGIDPVGRTGAIAVDHVSGRSDGRSAPSARPTATHSRPGPA
jgi:hypothetical protein